MATCPRCRKDLILIYCPTCGSEPNRFCPTCGGKGEVYWCERCFNTMNHPLTDGGFVLNNVDEEGNPHYGPANITRRQKAKLNGSYMQLNRLGLSDDEPPFDPPEQHITAQEKPWWKIW